MQVFSAAPSKSISGVITWTRVILYDITTKRIALMCWYLCSASSTVYPAKRCTRCRSEHLSASSVAETFDCQEPFPYGPTHGLALEFHLGLYLFCNFAHKALQWQQAPGSQQQEADRVTEHAEAFHATEANVQRLAGGLVPQVQDLLQRRLPASDKRWITKST